MKPSVQVRGGGCPRGEKRENRDGEDELIRDVEVIR